MKKKFKKVSIALIVLLMVIAGTLAWLVTSDAKKGKITSGGFSISVEAVEPVSLIEDELIKEEMAAPAEVTEQLAENAVDEDDDEKDNEADQTTAEVPKDDDGDGSTTDEEGEVNAPIQEEAPKVEEDNEDELADEKASEEVLEDKIEKTEKTLAVLPADGFEATDKELEIQSADDDSLSGLFHFEETDLYPISRSNTTALLDEDQTPTKYIRITNDNDVDAIIEVSAQAADGYEGLANGVSWMVAAPLSRVTNLAYNDEMLSYNMLGRLGDTKAVLAKNTLARTTALKMAGSASSDTFTPVVVDSYNDNGTYKLSYIGFDADTRENAIYTYYVNSDGDEIDSDEYNSLDDKSDWYPVVDSSIYYDTDDFDVNDVSSYLQRNVIIVSSSRILGKTDADTNASYLDSDELKLDADIFTEAPVPCSTIESSFVQSTLDADEAVPFVLRAHTSVVIPFKVFLNDNWASTDTDFQYNIEVNARNYRSGDKITYEGFGTTTKEVTLSDAVRNAYVVFNAFANADMYYIDLGIPYDEYFTFDDFNDAVTGYMDRYNLSDEEMIAILSDNINTILGEAFTWIADYEGRVRSYIMKCVYGTAGVKSIDTIPVEMYFAQINSVANYTCDWFVNELGSDAASAFQEADNLRNLGFGHEPFNNKMAPEAIAYGDNLTLNTITNVYQTTSAPATTAAE